MNDQARHRSKGDHVKKARVISTASVMNFTFSARGVTAKTRTMANCNNCTSDSLSCSSQTQEISAVI